MSKPILTDKDGNHLNNDPSSIRSLVAANKQQKENRPTLTALWEQCTKELLTIDHFTRAAIHNRYNRQELEQWLEVTNFRVGSENGKHYCCGFNEPDA